MRRPLLRTAALGLAAASLLLTVAAAPVEAEEEPEDEFDPIRAAQYWLEGARVPEAWEITRGAGVTIAIIDTGIGRTPLPFAEAVIDGTDVSGIGSSDGRRPVGSASDRDHGSWVASLAAARPAPDGTGMIGVAPEANLLSISVGFSSSATVPFTEQIANAMVWAVDHGADVINLSFTTNTLDWDPSWDAAFQYAFDKDVVVVVAAGNRESGTTVVGAPATIPGVLTVAGVDETGQASQSASTQGITIGISAPSEGLLGISSGGELVLWNGTSGAAPIVAGVAALVRAAHPQLDAHNGINRIISSAIPVPGVTRVPDPLYGYGLLDAYAAVTASVPRVSENPMGDLKEWVRVHRRAEVDPEPTPEPIPVEIPPLPPAEAPSEVASPFLPNASTLRYGTLPLVAVTLPGIVIALGVTAAARRIRLARTRAALPSDN